jgi:protein SFI1
VKRGRTRFERVATRGALRHWYRLAEDRARARAVAVKAARKLNVVRLRCRFESWRLAAADDLSSRAKMRRAAKAWTRRFVASAWRSWKASVDLDRVKRSAAASHFAVKTAVRCERSKRAAFSGWTEYVAYYKRTSRLVHKAYAKSRRIYTQSVFDQWCAFCDEVETRKETLKRCVTSKRLLTSWFLDWYWQAFEGDIAGAIGLITDSTETVIGSVYGENRGVDASVFRQWQTLGASLEALTEGADPRSPVRAAARKWREKTREAAEKLEKDDGDGDRSGEEEDDASFSTPNAARRPETSPRGRAFRDENRDVASRSDSDSDSDDDALLFRSAGRSDRATPAGASPSRRRRLSLSDEEGDSEDEIDRRVLSELGARR